FYELRDLDKAGTAYNKVRTEFSNSELAEPGQQKATAVTQLKTKPGFDPTNNLQQFVDYHITAAENYFSVFSLPDSALLMYQRIIDSRDSLQTLRDSLAVKLDAKQSLADSLGQALAALPEPVLPDSTEVEADSLAVANDAPMVADSLSIPGLEMELSDSADSLGTVDTMTFAETEADSLRIEEFEPGQEALPDSLGLPDMDPELYAEADSLGLPELDLEVPAEADSLAGIDEQEKAPDPEEQRRQLQQRFSAAETDLNQTRDRLEAMDALFVRYDRELTPMALFSQANIHSRTGPDRPRMEEIYSDMLTHFPNNKYTNAMDDLLAGETVRLIDPDEEAQELLLDRAFGMAESEPDSMLVILNELAASDYLPISLKANYRLGWFHTFEVPDTTAAKPYLDKVLELERTGEYGSMTSRFYDGRNFKLRSGDELPDSLAVADSLQALADSTAVADSLKPADGQEQEPEPQAEPEIKPQEDSPDLDEEESPDSDEAEGGEVKPETLPEESTPEKPKPEEPLPDQPAPDGESPEEPPQDDGQPGDDGGSQTLTPDGPAE
ncbi:MAG: hypothetical protein QM218_06095, partial [Candidatus Cloacimonadota bacterium]|nr:hypothetical protein [Candidatus Cloacimonadota bacterium]